MPGSVLSLGNILTLDAGLVRWTEDSEPSRPLVSNPYTTAIVLAVAYYVGARVGFAFQWPTAAKSVLWLPNAILLSALLLTAPRRWPLLLIAAFPAQMLIAWQNGTPPVSMALLYISNSLDAFLAATAVRVLARRRWHLDSLRNLGIFLAVGATIGPLLVSFLDSAIVVATGWNPDYWTNYATRLRANTLTNVLLVPTIVAALDRDTPWPWPGVRRVVEAVLVMAVLVTASIFVFSRDVHVETPALFALLVPVLMWAAVRFGMALTGAGLLVVAFVSTWNAVHGIGAFTDADPTRNVVALQFFLLCISVPLLCLAMLMQERADAAKELIASRNAVRVSIDTVRDLAGRLIAAQEEERARIGRELHDTVGQLVAEMALTLSTTRREPAVRAAGVDSAFQRMYEQTSDLFESVRSLSHQLHPSVLHHAGLVPAMQALCSTVQRQYDIPVDFEPQPVETVPDSVALCLYRVAQEALRNSAQHADAHVVRVRLARRATSIDLDVTDDGHGFDVALVRGSGLGLVSMEERVRLVQGTFDIRSNPAGTEVSVRVPVEYVE